MFSAMVEKSPRGRLEFAPFAILRLPRLPIDQLLTIGSTHEQVHRGLQQWLLRPEAQSAIRIASPTLYESLPHWVDAPLSARGKKIERALLAYFVRMCGRAVPFGLFASVSIIDINENSRIKLSGGSPQFRTHTRVDGEIASSIAASLTNDRTIRTQLRYFTNTSAYVAGDSIRFAAAVHDGTLVSHRLDAIEVTPYLRAVIGRTNAGALFDELVTLLVSGFDADRDEASSFIDQLIDAQLLVSALEPPGTGEEALPAILRELSPLGDSAATQRGALAQLRERLAESDRTTTAQASSVHDVAEDLGRIGLADLPASPTQVDLIRPLAGFSVGDPLLTEVRDGIEVLRRTMARARNPALDQFRRDFVSRFGEREVPLAEALDEDLGVGFDNAEAVATAAPLLEGLKLPTAEPPAAAATAQMDHLLRHIHRCWTHRDHELELDASDIESLALSDAPGFSPTFDVSLSVEAADEAAIARGEFRVFIRGATGTPGTRLASRFCHADGDIETFVKAEAAREQAQRPNELLVELVHVPQGRNLNIVSRPLLRNYELPYVGRSGAPARAQLTLDDIVIRIDGERVVLRSRSLGKEILPRHTTALDRPRWSLPIYRFICALQDQGHAGALFWRWGPLESAPFLPRVVTGRCVLSVARWRFQGRQKRILESITLREMERFRDEWRLPRWVTIVERDGPLPIDLESEPFLDLLAHTARTRDVVVLSEQWPATDKLCVKDTEGRYLHDLVLSVRAGGDVPRSTVAREPTRLAEPHRLQRSRPPGSEWIYAKLFAPPAEIDALLTTELQSLLCASHTTFFVRYNDPDWHLRLRVCIHDPAQRTEFLAALTDRAETLIGRGKIWRLQMDTYEREIERYGGLEAMGLAERLFDCDSRAVIRILSATEPAARWQHALLGVDRLLDLMRLDPAAKYATMKSLSERFAKEFRSGPDTARALGQRYRKESARLELLLAGRLAEAEPAQRAFAARAADASALVDALDGLREAGQLQRTWDELTRSFVHMHINRMMTSAARAHEMVIYDFLARLYLTRLRRDAG